jgi:hypothetical protein
MSNKDKLISSYNVESHHKDVVDEMNESDVYAERLNPDDEIPEYRRYEYDNLMDLRVSDDYEDICHLIGKRIIALKGKVHIIGSNLDWRGSNGEATFKSSSGISTQVGKEFLYKFCSCYNDFNLRMYYIGRYDTGKSFDLIVGHHDATSLMYIRPSK